MRRHQLRNPNVIRHMANWIKDARARAEVLRDLARTVERDEPSSTDGLAEDAREAAAILDDCADDMQSYLPAPARAC